MRHAFQDVRYPLRLLVLRDQVQKPREADVAQGQFSIVGLINVRVPGDDPCPRGFAPGNRRGFAHDVQTIQQLIAQNRCLGKIQFGDAFNALRIHDGLTS
jgi:hypothetical protein